MSSNYLKLIELIESYLNLDILPADFESLYINAWRKYRDFDDEKLIKKETQEFLDSVFCSIDAYCLDPSLRDENDLDEESLYIEINKSYNIWKSTL